MKIWPIVPAAGVGARMQADRPKQYLTLHGQFIMDHTLERLLGYPAFERLVLVLAEDDPWFEQSRFHEDSRIIRAPGGKERSDSVLNGLVAIQDRVGDDDWVLVHDVARPCLTHEDIARLIDAAEWPGIILASPTRDTMKRGVLVDGKLVIDHTVEREQLWHALTPQLFPYRLLKDSLNQCLEQSLAVTDEASAVEICGHQPHLVAGRADNLKVTRPEDLALADMFLQQQLN